MVTEKYLSQYRPAELHLLLSEVDSDWQELLKLTFVDLVFKKVLKTINVSEQASPYDPVRNYIYVTTDVNYNTYKAYLFENALLDIFEDNPTRKVLLRKFVNLAMEKSIGRVEYYELILKEAFYKKMVYRTFWQFIFTKNFSLSKSAKALRIQILTEIQKLEIELEALGDKKVQQLIPEIKGSILLLDHINTYIPNFIDSDILKEFVKKRGLKNGVGCRNGSNCYGCTAYCATKQ